MQNIMEKLQNTKQQRCNPSKLQSPVAVRLVEFITSKNLSVREFERSINVNQGWIHSMRSSVQPDKLKQILDKYPDLSVRYLYTGDGPMTENAAQFAVDKSGKTVMYIQAEAWKQIESLSATVKSLTEQNRALQASVEKLTDSLHRILKDGVSTGKSND